MSETIERNRQMLRLLCRAGQVLGWVLIIMSAFGLGSDILNLKFLLGRGTAILIQTFVGVTAYILTGLTIFVVVQLIRRLTEDDYQSGLILRNGHWFLFFLALCRLVETTVAPFLYAQSTGTVLSRIMNFLGWGLPNLTNMLILAGIGLALQLVLPIIDESKTLA